MSVCYIYTMLDNANRCNVMYPLLDRVGLPDEMVEMWLTTLKYFGYSGGR